MMVPFYIDAEDGLAKVDSLLLLTASFIVSCLSVELYRRLALRLQLMDHPNHRSSHQIPTPRGAGLIFILLWLIVLIIFYYYGRLSFRQLSFFSPLGLVLITGSLDDYWSLSAKLRFLVQIVAALLSLWALGGVTEWNLGFVQFKVNGMLGSSFALLLILWSTNLFNFMDGIDGLAATEALFVLLPLSSWVYLQGGFQLSLLMWLLSASIIGFLIWNWPKARIFMGDSGSSSLGFVLPLFALVAQQSFNISILCWLVTYGVFIFDASITLLRRVLAKQDCAQAHCLHAYQRLHQAGWSHKKVLIGTILINMLLALIAVLINFNSQYSLLGLLAAFGILSFGYGYVEHISPMFGIPRKS